MPKVVVFDKDGERYETNVSRGTELIDACEEAGVHLPASCGRGSECSTCAVTILKGEIGDGKDISPPMQDEELNTMERAGLNPTNQVLSCACAVYGDVEVQEAGSTDIM